ncbi:DNA adenine methylase [Lactiplantibacillus plantarum]|uniref:DNA adenine methylase n=1 Tax=Lactiplantibacillus plantarum TaxID=1590 RepID=UPI0021A3C9D9|nr:DNA adenine methylase [Lactiplantibacillus plantarum]MCT3246852.1 DNA adenine methylase [Lactiplantibacillus plantarum]
MNQLPQLLKWVGNKHKFANEIITYMPDKVNTYYEPFLGSASVLGQLIHENVNELLPPTKIDHYVGSDVLPQIPEIFSRVRDDPESLIEGYSYWRDQIQEDNKKKVYITALDRFNKEQKATDFVFVTRASYSGIVRFRKRDHYMSTPVGAHMPISSESFKQRVQLWHQDFSQVDAKFVCADYRILMEQARSGDVVYCDPPYGNSQGILYGAQSFSIDDLFIQIAKCKRKGVKVLLSYNGLKKSGTIDTRPELPEGLFESIATVDVGVSMVNRLQNGGKKMLSENVKDLLLMTW